MVKCIPAREIIAVRDLSQKSICSMQENHFLQKFQNYFAVNLKLQMFSAKPNYFWELISRVLPLFAALAYTYKYICKIRFHRIHMSNIYIKILRNLFTKLLQVNDFTLVSLIDILIRSVKLNYLNNSTYFTLSTILQLLCMNYFTWTASHELIHWKYLIWSTSKSFFTSAHDVLTTSVELLWLTTLLQYFAWTTQIKMLYSNNFSRTSLL